jgi:hypothetical protein
MAEYSFEFAHDDRVLTVRDLRAVGWWNSDTVLEPPTDIVVSGPAFSCCATCADTEPTRRCSGCPRGTATSKFVERIRRCQG